jgi:lipopolysaccharide/colanic/teichoic acid biosynthesis glycosyltransferase
MSTTPDDATDAVFTGASSRLRAMNLAAKRCIDVIASAVGLTILAPLLALIALMIAMEGDRGPILYRQERYGRHRRIFWILKFRTLTTCETTDGFRQVTTGDTRVTKTGAFLRSLNLDELPQLWNVLCGDMSLVGPRPHPLLLDRQFEHEIANYWARYSVRPGITGWAQVMGLRGPTSEAGSMARRVEADLHYIRNFSLWFDLRVLARTLLPIVPTKTSS